MGNYQFFKNDLQIKNTIKCANKKDLITTHNELALNGVYTDFLYEKDGEQGLWLIVEKIKE